MADTARTDIVRLPVEAAAPERHEFGTRPLAAVVGVDVDGTIVQASDSITHVLGWSPDDIVGQPLLLLIPPRFHDAHTSGFEGFVRSGELDLAGQTLRLPALGRDGDEVDIELVLSPAAIDDPAAVIGLMRRSAPAQITAGSELTALLRAKLSADEPLAEILRDCMELIGDRLGWRLGTMWIVDPWIERLRPVAVWEADPGTSPSYTDGRAAALLACGESIPGTVWQTGAPVWSEEVESELGVDGLVAGLFFPLVAEGVPVGVVELVDEAAHGFTIEAQEYIWLVADELGRILGQRMRTDVADAARERLELALSARGMGVWTYRIATDEFIGDEQLHRLYGFDPRSFSGRVEDVFDRIHPDDRYAVRERILQSVEHHEPFHNRYRVCRSDGTEAWIEGSGLPLIDLEGEVRELTGVCFEVTDEVRDRAELEERARYAALAADVGRALVSEDPLEEKLRRSVQAIVDNLDAAFARIWTLGKDSDMLVLRASAGQYTHLDGPHSRVRVGEFKIGLIAATLEPHLTNSVVGDPRVSDQEWAVAEGMKSFAGYPLVIGDRCVGVLGLFARRMMPLSALEALGSISDTLAVGIEQSRVASEVRGLLQQEQLHAETLEALLLDRARVAKVLQESLLPPSLPDVPGFDVAAQYRAGVEEVGGDFYDLLPLPGDSWAFLVGDICGRGPEAARLTALARHSLRTAVMLEKTPAEALAALNEALLRSGNDGRFCTAVCGVLTLQDDVAQIEMGIAGHPPPIVVHADGTISEHDPTGPLLGLFADARFGQRSLTLGRDELLVMYTDGVTEARGGAGLFGVRRLRAMLGRLAGCPALSVVEAVVDAVDDFDESSGQDDVALLVLGHTGTRGRSSP